MSILSVSAFAGELASLIVPISQSESVHLSPHASTVNQHVIFLGNKEGNQKVKRIIKNFVHGKQKSSNTRGTR